MRPCVEIKKRLKLFSAYHSFPLRRGRASLPSLNLLTPRRLPVTLLTGFLGSGKTSLLQHLLAAPGFPRERTAVIVNDFGAVNIDAALLAEKVSRIAALTAGCLCCTGSAELGRALLTLADDPAIDQAWIEASGIAETDDLLDKLTDARLVRRIVVAQVIHILDASAYPGWWTNRPLAQEQLRWADLLVINKTDISKPKAIEKIDEDIARFNPKALRIEAIRGEIDLPASHASARARYRAQTRTGEVAVSPHPEPATTFFLPLEKPVSRRELDRRLSSAPPEAGEIYRAKGFLRFDDAPEQLSVFQKAGDQVESIIWNAAEPGLPCGLVLLGRHLDEAALAAHFAGL